MTKPRSSFGYFPEAKSFLQLCHSSFAGNWPGMPPELRAIIRKDLLEQAAFCEISVAAFTLRPSSFSLLLEVPIRLRLTKKEMIARVEAHLSAGIVNELVPLLRRNDSAGWQRAEGYFGSVGGFFKRFKHQMAHRYHQHHNTGGTLWNSRFEAAFVEPGHAARIVAAWVDHACARATPGTRPEDDPFCTIGSAAAGNPAARSMIQALFSNNDPGASWRATLKSWQDFCNGEPDHPKPPRAGTVGPPLTRSQLLLHPLPHFHGGLAIGSRDFVERLFELNAHYFGDQRSTGARFLVGQNDPDLFTLRDKGDLRKPPRSQRPRSNG